MMKLQLAFYKMKTKFKSNYESILIIKVML